MGSCKFEACEECNQKCLLIHGNKNPSPIVSSFFKIMLGDDFMTTLVIPPSFSQTIMSLVDQKVELEDSKGNRWMVQLSSVDDFLVFKQGWDQFASDHSLEIGEFLIFNYIIGSHFVVQIYCTSGREKMNFSNKNTSSTEKSSTADTSFELLMEDGGRSTPAEVSTPINDRGCHYERGSYSSVHSNADKIPSEPTVPTVEVMPMSTGKTIPCSDRAVKTKPLLPSADTVPSEPNDPTVDFMPVSAEETIPSGDRAAITKPLLPNADAIPSELNIPCGLSTEKAIPCGDRAAATKPLLTLPNEDTIPKEPNVPILEVMATSIEKTSPCGDSAAITKPQLPNVCSEIPVYIVERDSKESPDMNRRSLFELADSEMVEGSSGVEPMDKGPVVRESGRVPPSDAKLVQLQTRQEKVCVETQCDIIEKQLTCTKGACGGADPSGITDFNVPERRLIAQDVNKVPLFQEQSPIDDHTSWQPQGCDSMKEAPLLKDQILMVGSTPTGLERTSRTDFLYNEVGKRDKINESFENETSKPDQANGTFRGYSLPEKRKAVYSGMDSMPPTDFGVIAEVSRPVPKIIKQEPGCSNAPSISRKYSLPAKRLKVATEGPVRRRGRPRSVKVEIQEEINPVRASSSFPNSGLQYCFSVYVVTGSFLEFPSSSTTLFSMGKMKREKKMVYLRDPARRLWSVLYHETMGFKVLGCGWGAIVQANDIQPGDHCVFEVEDESRSLFRLHVTRK